MKKSWIAAVLVALVLLACGCTGKQQEASAVAQSKSFQTADELISEAEARQQQQSSSAAPQAAPEVTGVYRCSLPDVDEQFWPSLTLDASGEAVLQVNLLAGMGMVKADYTTTETAVKLLVTAVGFTGFSGEKVTELVFDLLPDGNLELAYMNPDEPVGISVSGDRFVKES